VMKDERIKRGERLDGHVILSIYRIIESSDTCTLTLTSHEWLSNTISN
jgi:hypothetical protein